MKHGIADVSLRLFFMDFRPPPGLAIIFKYYLIRRRSYAMSVVIESYETGQQTGVILGESIVQHHYPGGGRDLSS